MNCYTIFSHCTENYSIPSGVFIFFGCLSSMEWRKIALYLGFDRETLDKIVEQYPNNTEHQVSHNVYGLKVLSRGCTGYIEQLYIIPYFDRVSDLMVNY